jgi:hypothetical protein
MHFEVRSHVGDLHHLQCTQHTMLSSKVSLRLLARTRRGSQGGLGESLLVVTSFWQPCVCVWVEPLTPKAMKQYQGGERTKQSLTNKAKLCSQSSWVAKLCLAATLMFKKLKGSTSVEVLPINLPNSSNTITERLDHLNCYFCIMGTPPRPPNHRSRHHPGRSPSRKKTLTTSDEVHAVLMRL